MDQPSEPGETAKECDPTSNHGMSNSLLQLLAIGSRIIDSQLRVLHDLRDEELAAQKITLSDRLTGPTLDMEPD